MVVLSRLGGQRKEVREGEEEGPRGKEVDGRRAGVSEVQQHSLWDWNTSVQHHIPFHTEFFSRLPYIKQTFSAMCIRAAWRGKTPQRSRA